MGEHEERAQPQSGLLPNGLLPNEAASVIQVLDSERWLKAEQRTAELIACIQPNSPSEQRRNAVAEYVQKLITQCFPCQVFTFGSVPLKTYLPDGDIDLTAFCKNQSLKDNWAQQVRDMLENEEKNENAVFHVKEVQYIQAEVKIIKCLVENIVVDISFNQLGGLCTLCFLEEVDSLISQNHLFKRSIILIKAWCYYESRILGAHHGLISTYALETLVLYIFHVFNNSFTGPLEVLYRFLEFFSKFDWENFCVSLWGPVAISSLPDVTAEPPRKDAGELLLSKIFLNACSTVYSVFPGGQENQGQPFVSKYFNVIDPLRVNNNLGRSVSKGNFFRIRSAFAFGARKLARLLDCPKDELLLEVNQFFLNTWDRHGSGHRPDVPSNDLRRLRLSNHDQSQGSENNRNNNHKIDNTANREFLVERENFSHSGLSQQSNVSSENSSKNSDLSTVSRTQSQKSYVNQNTTRNLDQVRRETNSTQGAYVDKSQRNVKTDIPVHGLPGRFVFARTRSSPELTDSYGEVSSQGRRARTTETIKGQNSFVKLENGRKNNFEPDVAARVDDSSSRHSSRQFVGSAESISNHDEQSSGVNGKEFASVAGAGGMQMMSQEEQDLLNMMASPAAQGFSGQAGQAHVPMNLPPGHLPFPFPPSVLASMGYGPRNMANIPFIEAPWGTNMQFPQGLVPSPLHPYLSGFGFPSHPQDLVETGHENFRSVEINVAEVDNGFWHDQERSSPSGVEADNGNSEMLSDDKKQSTSGSYNFSPSSRAGSSSSSARIHPKFTRETRGSPREEHIDNFHYQDGRRNDTYFDNRIENSELPSAPPPSRSFRSKSPSESSWDESSAKSSKSTREKRGKKSTPSVPSTVYGKSKKVSENLSNRTDDENREWTPLLTMSSDLSDRSTEPATGTSMHVPRHQISGSEAAQTSGSDSQLPIAPVVLGPGSRQKAMDNSGVLPYAFYPTGPPVPFVTMLPLYNFPTESSETSTSNFNGEEGGENSDSGLNFDSSEGYDHHSEVSSPSNSMTRASIESSDHKPDILHSDFVSHWQNLQFGRFCQNPSNPPSMMHPSPVMVPPAYLQGQYPWDGPGRPPAANMNLVTQLMNYGPRLVPVPPLQSVSNRPANIYQRFVEDMPRYRSGTGTYLPNPKVSVRDRQSTNTRRGNYSFDRSDHHGDREGNWNMNSKLRSSGRSHNRNQGEKPSSKSERLSTSESRAERPWSNHRHDSFIPHQNGPVRGNSSQNNHANVAYGMYSIPGMNPSGASSNGPTMPSVVMLYPYDHNAGYSSPAEQLEFGSLGPMGFSGANELPQPNEGSRSGGGALEEQRFHGGPAQQSSPDQPSSPHVSRGPDSNVTEVTRRGL